MTDRHTQKINNKFFEKRQRREREKSPSHSARVRMSIKHEHVQKGIRSSICIAAVKFKYVRNSQRSRCNLKQVNFFIVAILLSIICVRQQVMPGTLLHRNE